MTREDLLRLIQDMDEQELYTLMGLYLIESLKGKFAKEDYGQRTSPIINHRNIH
jgi:hypothetical protein